MAKLNSLVNLVNNEEMSPDENDGVLNCNTEAQMSSKQSRRMSSSPRRLLAVSKSRHRRSRSLEGDRILDDIYVVRSSVPVNSVLQPILKTRRSQTKPDNWDLNKAGGSGKQVVFNNDNVSLRHGKDRKRSYEEFKGIEERIADLECLGLEGDIPLQEKGEGKGKGPNCKTVEINSSLSIFMF